MHTQLQKYRQDFTQKETQDVQFLHKLWIEGANYIIVNGWEMNILVKIVENKLCRIMDDYTTNGQFMIG